MDSDWIEHHGKGYPDLPLDTLVQVRFADGEVNEGSWGATVEFWNVNWVHDEPKYHADITHYRVVTP